MLKEYSDYLDSRDNIKIMSEKITDTYLFGKILAWRQISFIRKVKIK